MLRGDSPVVLPRRNSDMPAEDIGEMGWGTEAGEVGDLLNAEASDAKEVSRSVEALSKTPPVR